MNSVHFDGCYLSLALATALVINAAKDKGGGGKIEAAVAMPVQKQKREENMDITPIMSKTSLHTCCN